MVIVVVLNNVPPIRFITFVTGPTEDSLCGATTIFTAKEMQQIRRYKEMENTTATEDQTNVTKPSKKPGLNNLTEESTTRRKLCA